MPKWLFLIPVAFFSTGCSLLPDIAHEPRVHNPFPQLHRVAVLPFYNQSTEPTLNGEQVAIHYYTELQQIPGFEVIPVGVVRQYLLATRVEPRSAEDFQQIAQELGVDAVVVGAITEYSPYYPPRIGLAVRWYAANPGFHEIPAGYGLPWGTPLEEYIPDDLLFEAEFALAKEQLKTQTPSVDGEVGSGLARDESALRPSQPLQDDFPRSWPDPQGFIPDSPCPARPPLRPHRGPVMSHVRLYDGHDADVTQSLASYYYFRDDARFGGWQGYLQRSDDFIRFSCYLHLCEMLAARGGADKTRVVWRWPIGRYER